MEELEIECCKCGHECSHDDCVVIKDDEFSKSVGAEVTVNTCPKCGHDEFYDIN